MKTTLGTLFTVVKNIQGSKILRKVGFNPLKYLKGCQKVHTAADLPARVGTKPDPLLYVGATTPAASTKLTPTLDFGGCSGARKCNRRTASAVFSAASAAVLNNGQERRMCQSAAGVR
jgi:hypothetical protein